jgi:organic hydroperoxide reductase OsmC/OhrA
MSSYQATIAWQRGDAGFLDNAYSRGHEWHFDGGLSVPASASPSIVPLPMSVAENVDPEEAFVAALASCHMLFFLSLAAGRGVVVDTYRDDVIGYMEKNAEGRMAMTRVVLRPRATYSGSSAPDPVTIQELHDAAHERCFIANSVKTHVVTEVIA